MQRYVRRALALVMAALLAMTAFTAAVADDWRDLLRNLYGLSEDYEIEKQTEVDNGEPQGQTKVEFELPVTDPQQIVNYLSIYGELPENFITKDEAKALGWGSRYRYVGEAAPGKSIGGDRFSNFEGQLPNKKGRKWYECDANYDGKKRDAQRVVYSSDGLYYFTDDHYKTFTEMFPED